MSTAHTFDGAPRATTSTSPTAGRAPGITALVAPVVMFAGAAVWAGSGTDIDAAVSNRTVDEYLAAVTATPDAVYVHLLLWIVGAPLLAVAAVMLADRWGVAGPGGVAARASAYLGGALAIVAFSVWFGLLELRGGAASADLVHALGFLASRIDWIATVLLIGFPPLLLSVAAGRPRWQRLFGMVAGIAGVVALVSTATGNLGVAFPVVPIGLAWFVAAGITELRRTGVRRRVL